MYRRLEGWQGPNTHLSWKLVYQDLVRFFSNFILFRNLLPCVETKLRR